MASIRKAVFPVGGLGTRFLPATKSMPKEMLPVMDKPLIQYALEEAQAAGIEEFIFVTGRGKSAIEDHFDLSYELEATLSKQGKSDALSALKSLKISAGQISYTRQQEPLGLGHAVWCARYLVGDEPFAVLLVDDFIVGSHPCLKQMVEAYEEIGGNIVATMDVPYEHVIHYGILDILEDKGSLVLAKGMVEKPSPDVAPSNSAIIGRYILQPEVFQHLEKQKQGAGNEVQLTDALVPMLKSYPFHGMRFEGRRFDCGVKSGMLLASLYIGLEQQVLDRDFVSELESILADFQKDSKMRTSKT
jgi:UTP--glucose-1-phosphate uridylyltransferase